MNFIYIRPTKLNSKLKNLAKSRIARATTDCGSKYVSIVVMGNHRGLGQQVYLAVDAIVCCKKCLNLDIIPP